MTRTLSAQECREIAAGHERARVTATPIHRISRYHPQMTIDDAYACQTEWVRLQVEAGARIVGHKIGLTSRAMQSAMKIDEPDYGTLLDYMIHPSGVSLRAADYIDPRLEVELAFVLGARLEGTDVTAADVVAATEWIVPALELIDARSYRVDPDDGVTRTVFDTIADNAADAGVVLGATRVKPSSGSTRYERASISSRAGTIHSVAAKTSAAVTSVPSSRAPSTNASSTSSRGSM